MSAPGLRCHVGCVGVSHKSAPVELRERLALDPAASCRLAAALVTGPVSGALAVSTCNRTELYVSTYDLCATEPAVHDALARFSGVQRLEAYSYVHVDRAAIAHLFGVAAGLDSMVVGETEILAQLRGSLEVATTCHTSGHVLGPLFQRALETGKRVHTETHVGRRSVSVGSVAVELAARRLDGLAGRTVLVLGAGAGARSVAARLPERGVSHLLVCSRTVQAAGALAAECDGHVVSWDDLDEHLELADVVICSTAAPHCVLTPGIVQRVMDRRRGRELLVIDMAVPRDCEPDVGAIAGVTLFDIDDLRDIVVHNQDERQRHAVRAGAIVSEQVDKAEAWLTSLSVTPVIRALRDDFHRIGMAELDRTLRRLGDADARTADEVRQLSTRLINKLLHLPSVRLKDVARDESAAESVEVVRYLFGLDEDQPCGPSRDDA